MYSQDPSSNIVEVVNSRTPINKVKEVLRLKFEENFSHRKVAKTLNLGIATVSDVLHRFRQAKLQWPLSLTNDQLEESLYPNRASKQMKVKPNFGETNLLLKRQGITKEKLWKKYYEEYKGCAYGSTQFHELYNRWYKKQKPSVRQTHTAGDAIFVNYVSPNFSVVNPETGESRDVIIFVASLGASNYTYIETFESSDIESAVMANVNALSFFDGLPNRLVTHQQTSFGRKTSSFNKNHQQLSEYYGLEHRIKVFKSRQSKRNMNIPLRVATRWLLQRLHSNDFYTLASLDSTLKNLSQKLNRYLVKPHSESRKSLFELLEKPVLRSLPIDHYTYVDRQKLKAGINHHVRYQKHYYSVPERYHGEYLDIQASASSIEIYSNGQLATQHVRKHTEYGFSTVADHMPKDKSKYKWSPQSILRWSKEIGSATAIIIDAKLNRKPHPEHSYLACFNILNLAKIYSKEQLEYACKNARHLERINSKVIERLIEAEQ